ncbi:MAG TPA: ParB N-terminal domain-containing protein, partial [Tianweitania sediminis]|nr:ParB N-terminal domain-containing protein [Tianweitania sediminis]
MIQIISLPVAQLRRHSAARDLNDATVATIADSIAKLGLINPVRVRRSGDGYEVIAGHHRFAAVGSLGLADIDCIVVDDDDVAAEMAMIAENLHRSELSKLERDEQISRWIELSKEENVPAVNDAPIDPDEADFEAFCAVVEEAEEAARANAQEVSGQVDQKPHGGRPEGGNLQSAQVAPNESKRADGRGHRPEGGIRAAARELGIDRDDARRAVTVASLSPEAKAAAKASGLDNNRSALLAASKETTPEAQVKALEERKQGGIAGRIKPAAPAASEPSFDDIASMLDKLWKLSADDFLRICPPPKRAVMCQRMSRLA